MYEIRLLSALGWFLIIYAHPSKEERPEMLKVFPMPSAKFKRRFQAEGRAVGCVGSSFTCVKNDYDYFRTNVSNVRDLVRQLKIKYPS